MGAGIALNANLLVGKSDSDIKYREESIMLNITNELKTKLLTAKSVEEVTALVKAAGQDITAEEAEKLWAEIKARREQDGKELSVDELDAVSGGATDRNWLLDGCAATVEEGSNCWGTDGGCVHINIHYSYFNQEFKCPNYAGPHQYEEISSVVHTVNGLPVIEGTYRCKYCGCTCVQWGTRSW